MNKNYNITYEQIIRDMKISYIMHGNISKDCTVYELFEHFKSIFNHNIVYEERVDRHGSLYHYKDKDIVNVIVQGSGGVLINGNVFNYLEGKCFLNSSETLYKLIRYYLKYIIKDEHIDIDSVILYHLEPRDFFECPYVEYKRIEL